LSAFAVRVQGRDGIAFAWRLVAQVKGIFFSLLAVKNQLVSNFVVAGCRLNVFIARSTIGAFWRDG
jgi:hypothetical protein